jgi:hypothetical protein
VNQPIRVGDLVMVVRGNCNCNLGHMYRVARLDGLGTGWVTCKQCGSHNHFSPEQWAIANDGPNMPTGFPCAWLKRIPPLTEPTEQTNEVEA